MSHRLESEKETAMRRRVAAFIQDDEDLRFLLPEEIRLAIRGAIAEVREWITVRDGALN